MADPITFQYALVRSGVVQPEALNAFPDQGYPSMLLFSELPRTKLNNSSNPLTNSSSRFERCAHRDFSRFD